MTFLLDTVTVSDLRIADRPSGNRGLAEWASATPERDMYLSVITVMEIEQGILAKQRRDATQGRILRSWFQGRITGPFAGRFLPVDVHVALRAAATHVPDPRPYRDALIAATAHVHDLIVVTRNVRDFKSLGVRYLNPWT